MVKMKDNLAESCIYMSTWLLEHDMNSIKYLQVICFNQLWIENESIEMLPIDRNIYCILCSTAKLWANPNKITKGHLLNLFNSLWLVKANATLNPKQDKGKMCVLHTCSYVDGWGKVWVKAEVREKLQFELELQLAMAVAVAAAAAFVAGSKQNGVHM